MKNWKTVSLVLAIIVLPLALSISCALFEPTTTSTINYDTTTTLLDASWSYFDTNITSQNYPNNYPNTCNQSVTINFANDCAIRVHFSKFNTQLNADVVTLYDQDANAVVSYSGRHDGLLADAVLGQRITVHFTSDYTTTESGWVIDRIYYKATNLPPASTTTTTVAPLREWTIMVYICADNNLEPYALADVNEMESVASFQSNMNVIVLLDRTTGYSTADGDWEGTRLYEIKPDFNTSAISSTRLAGMNLHSTGDIDELDMGDTNTLAQFVDFCETYYPANQNMLVMWNHGDGWRKDTVLSKGDLFTKSDSGITKAVCYDDNSGNMIPISGAAAALAGKNLGVVGFDACLMGMFEVAYEFRNVADYMVASPDLVPGNGYPYDTWLTTFLSSGSTNALMLCQKLVDAYGTEYAAYSSTTLSVYDLSQTGALMTAWDNYSLGLCATTNDYWPLAGYTNNASDEFVLVTNSVDGYGASDGVYYHLDMWEMADKMSNGSSAAAKTAIENLVVYEWHNTSGDLVSGNPNAHGIAVYYPDQVDYSAYAYAGYYTNVNAFNSQSKWIKYVRALNTYPPYPIMQPGVAKTGNFLSSDFVFYQFYVNSGGTLTVTLTVGSGCDDDLFLVKDGVLVDSSEGYTSTETINYDTGSTTGFYVVGVMRYDGTASPNFNVTVTEGTADVH